MGEREFSLPDLPADMADAYERFKLSILRHRISGWYDVSCMDVLHALNDLKRFAKEPPP